MRVLICALALVLAGCEGDDRPMPASPKTLPYGIEKFTDGPVTCYLSNVYGGEAISCVAQPQTQLRKEDGSVD